MMMQLAYIIAFQCLLHLKKVLRIQAHHIEFHDHELDKVSLVLNFCKTYQKEGEYCPFT